MAATTPASCPYSTSDVVHHRKDHRFTLACADGEEAVLSYTGPEEEATDGNRLVVYTITSIDVPESARGQHVEDLLVVVARSAFDDNARRTSHKKGDGCYPILYATINMSDELRGTLTVADGAFAEQDVEVTYPNTGVGLESEYAPADFTYLLDLGQSGHAALVLTRTGEPDLEAMVNSIFPITKTTMTLSTLYVPESDYVGVGDFLVKIADRRWDHHVHSWVMRDEVASQVVYSVNEEGELVRPAHADRLPCVVM